MKRCAFVAFVSLVLCVSRGAAIAETTRSIDVAASKVQFSIAHVFVEHVVGTVPVASGSVTFASDSQTPSAVNVSLDATRVTTGDRDQTACIQSDDYFDVKRFPVWTFVSTKITPRGATAFSVDGTLTMHGVTQPEHLDVAIAGDPTHPVYRATGHVDRHAFGMKGSRLDPAIGGIADLTLDVELK